MDGVRQLWMKEDWWAVWLGLGVLMLALVTFLAGGSIGGWAVTPGGWANAAQLGADLGSHLVDYLVIYLLFGVVFTVSMKVMGWKLAHFVPAYTVIFIGSTAIFYLASSSAMAKAHLGAPLLALIIGLVVGNLFRLPGWFEAGLRTEYYIKTGIVLLGATLPLTLIFEAGGIAFLQATIVSVCTWLTIFLAATKLFKMEPQFGAVLGAGGAVCGVSASIAVGGAVKAHKDHIAIGIAVVSVWAIVMILTLTFVTKVMTANGMITAGEAGAWVGTSEFADAAGFAVVAELATDYGDSPINTFTLMKVIGRDIWIGIWCLVLSIVSVTLWERSSEGERSRVGPGIIWQRFPKFVIGFFAASIIMSSVAANAPAEFVGTAPVSGVFKTKGGQNAYDADFSSFQVPADLEQKFSYDAVAGTIEFRGGVMREAEFKSLRASAQTSDQRWALTQLRHNASWFETVLKKKVISPVKKLRSWAFVLCFLCIGLSTRIRDLLTFGLKPFWAFTIGVLVNVPLGYVLSTMVFSKYWKGI